MPALASHMREADPVGELGRGLVHAQSILVAAVDAPEAGSLYHGGAQREEVSPTLGDFDRRDVVALGVLDLPPRLRDVGDRGMRVGEVSEVAALVRELERKSGRFAASIQAAQRWGEDSNA